MTLSRPTTHPRQQVLKNAGRKMLQEREQEVRTGAQIDSLAPRSPRSYLVLAMKKYIVSDYDIDRSIL